MAYSRAKFKSNGDKASPCFRPFWMGNVPNKYLTTSIWTLLFYYYHFSEHNLRKHKAKYFLTVISVLRLPCNKRTLLPITYIHLQSTNLENIFITPDCKVAGYSVVTTLQAECPEDMSSTSSVGTGISPPIMSTLALGPLSSLWNVTEGCYQG
jgi:hypothetical protein